MEERLISYLTEFLPTHSYDEIKKQLLKDGWQKSEIQEAYENIRGKSQKNSNEKLIPEKPEEVIKTQETPKINQQEIAKKENKKPDKQIPDDIRPIKHRNPFLVFLFGLITLGIYWFVWLILTTRELRHHTQPAPNPHMLWIPSIFIVAAIGTLSAFGVTLDITYGIISAAAFLIAIIFMIIYYAKYSKALRELTNFSAAGMFFLFLLVGWLAPSIAQVQLNKKVTRV